MAVLVSVFAFYDVIGDAESAFDRPSWLVLVGLMLAITLPLVWRRRFPLVAAMFVVGGLLFELAVLEVPERSVTWLAGSVALYSAAVYGRPRVRGRVLALCLAALQAQYAYDLFFNGAVVRPLAGSFQFAYHGVILALPWALGTAIRALRKREVQLAERADELQREREENARQAVFAERVRIARELHDVVAHHVSVMGIQAGAARRVMEQQPAKAADALVSIEASSREAVGELHRLLGFLRRGEADEIAPQPRFSELPDLIAQASQAGLAVRLAIDGEPQPIPQTLEVSVYRIIQEALTNARKHSSAGVANVRLGYTDYGLEVEVVNDGPCRAGAADEGVSGHGLIGMRERAGLHGGHFWFGPLPDGGFAVRATFPLAVGP